ncbi:hypothetical protein [Neisseria meningitidis]
MKPQTVQIVRQGEATLYWFLLIHYKNKNQYSVASPCRTICTVCGFVALS